MTTKGENRIRKQRINEAKKGFTREKALNALNKGADFSDEKFTKHPNYHVRMRAWHLSGAVVPDDNAAKKTLCEELVKGRTDAGKAKVEALFGLA